jgi:hypothetical protein
MTFKDQWDREEAELDQEEALYGQVIDEVKRLIAVCEEIENKLLFRIEYKIEMLHDLVKKVD